MEGDGDIASEAIRFFSDLYSESVAPSSELLQLIPPVLTWEDNLAMEDIRLLGEVKRVFHATDGAEPAGAARFFNKIFNFWWGSIAHE